MSVSVDDESVIEFPALDTVTLESGGAEEKPRTRRRRSDAGVPRGTRSGTNTRSTKTVNAKQLEQDLLGPIAKLGQAVSFSLPTVGAVLIARGEVTSKAIVSYAQGHPRMLEALAKIGQVGPASEVIETVAMCVIAANLDLRRMTPNHPVAVLTGVSQIHMDIYGHMYAAQAEAAEADQAPPTGGFDNIQTPPDGTFSAHAPPPVYVSEGFAEDGTFSAPPMFAAGQSAAVRNDI